MKLTDFGEPATFVFGNLLDFEQGLRLLEEKFQQKYGGKCDPAPQPPGVQPPKPPEPPKPPQPPKPPEPPVPPKPKKKPKFGIITPQPPLPQEKPQNLLAGIVTPNETTRVVDQQGQGDFILRLLDQFVEANVSADGFDPLNEAQVQALFGDLGSPGGVTPPPVINPPFSITYPLATPPSFAYFAVNGGITSVPSGATASFVTGTDNPTQGFFFPLNSFVFEVPAIGPGLSAIFPIGAPYSVIIRNTATGERFSLSITVNLSSVSITGVKL